MPSFKKIIGSKILKCKNITKEGIFFTKFDLIVLVVLESRKPTKEAAYIYCQNKFDKLIFIAELDFEK
jgi:hypothetical protein